MTPYGSGSMKSPIIISDDEDLDEAFVANSLLTTFNSSNDEAVEVDVAMEFMKPYALRPPFSMTKTLGYNMLSRTEYLPGRGLGCELNGQVEPVGIGMDLKKQRPGCGIGYLGPPSTLDVDDEPIVTETDSKKRKRELSHGQVAPTTRRRTSESKSSQSCELEESTLSPRDPHRQQNDRSLSRPPPPYDLLPPSLFEELPLQMAPPANHPDVPGSFVPWQEFLDPLAGYNPYPHDTISMDEPMPVTLPPKKPTSIKTSNPSSPPKKPQNTKNILPIGVHTNVNSCNALGTFPIKHGPPPDPACTIVLDDIPLRYCHANWVKNWASKAGNAVPVKVDINVKLRTGLAEWHDAKFAQQALASPRLTGKGKGSIRARWYRADGARSREVEEGEIEETSFPSSGFQPRKDQPSLYSKLNRPQTQDMVSGSAASNVLRKQKKRLEKRLSIASSKSSSIDAGKSGTQVPQEDVSEDMEICSSPLNPEFNISGDDRGIFGGSSSVKDQIAAHEEDAPIGSSTSLEQVEGRIISSTSTSVQQLNSPDTSLLIAIADSVANHRSISKPTPSTTSLPVSSPPVSGNPTCSEDKNSKATLNEDRISRNRSALGIASNVNDSLPEPSTSHPSSLSLKVTSSIVNESTIDKLAMEKDLRRLVLESKKRKLMLGNPALSSLPHRQSPNASLSPPSRPNSETAIHASPRSQSDFAANGSNINSSSQLGNCPVSNDLEDLAISFITEAIETVQPPVLHSTPPNIINELALKQQRLEQHIIESKALMAKLTRARNKEDKENVLNAIREHNRKMDLDSTDLKGGEKDMHKDSAFVAQILPTKSLSFCWPASCLNSIVVVSDDEDEE